MDAQRRGLKGMMGDSDGFKMAMAASMKDTDKGNNMQAMMSDTAGFQKILEMSKKEEEARIAKQKTIQDNENKLVMEGIRKSQANEEVK